MFKEEKTTLIYFIRNPRLQINTPLYIRGVEIRPQKEIKILNIIIDLRLCFKNYIKKILIKGLIIVLAPKRMRILTPAAARQLFNAIVAPVIDYVLSVWMHTLGPATTKIIR